MKFTTHYARILETNGQPHLNMDEFRKLFNIICLENRIDELAKAEGMVSSEKLRDHFTRIEYLKTKMNKLTNYQPVHMVFDEMLLRSQE